MAAQLSRQLRDLGINVTVLESDALRKLFSTQPQYDDQDREYFYASLVFIGRVLIDHGISVIFDATANRRKYRDRDATRSRDSLRSSSTAHWRPACDAIPRASIEKREQEKRAMSRDYRTSTNRRKPRTWSSEEIRMILRSPQECDRSPGSERHMFAPSSDLSSDL